MGAGEGSGADGVPSLHVHPGHAFEGFELAERASSRAGRTGAQNVPKRW